MPDGNGQVQSVTVLECLSDGRLVLGIDIANCVSQLTGQTVTSYGVFDLNPRTGLLTTEWRHDYLPENGGVPNQLQAYSEQLRAPRVLDNEI